MLFTNSSLLSAQVAAILPQFVQDGSEQLLGPFDRYSETAYMTFLYALLGSMLLFVASEFIQMRHDSKLYGKLYNKPHKFELKHFDWVKPWLNKIKQTCCRSKKTSGRDVFMRQSRQDAYVLTDTKSLLQESGDATY